MKTLLVVNSSPNQHSSTTRELAQHYTDSWLAQHPTGQVVQRDLVETPLQPLDSDTIAAFYTTEDQRDEAAKQRIALSDQLVAELAAADDVVIAAPMHNFSVPGSLKLWIDLICRVGVTFRYGEAGPIGLLQGKKATLITSRGGRYSAGSYGAALNHQDTMLTTVLGFVGITEVNHVTAEGMSGENTAKDEAKLQLSALFS
ncbi:NAD(P)H-dependent oxidoreductase [uncultured Ferrimonas sp.]|uniref:FMN-dependent NADH-azoreductase n=1 Tax=uncultured Ferrimonas sp. TaxID=432640 RepID=UPI0026199C68|nr:NAD(P)H-dependent oxidoreductase [uncultured Ferrimonas sp.]